MKVAATLDVRSVVLACIVVAVAVNLVQFPAIEATTPDRYQAVHAYRTHDLVRIARSFKLVRFRYEAALALGEVAPGATLILPATGSFPARGLVGEMIALGRISDTRTLAYDPETLAPSLDVKQHVIARSATRGRPKHLKRKFVVLARSSVKHKGRVQTSAREFILLKRGADLVIADTALLQAELGQPRT
jgi:hypothetical protein